MPREMLRFRVDRLEQRVDNLMALRDSMDGLSEQFFQFRDETRSALTALHEDISAVRDDLREEIHAVATGLREELRAFRNELREEVRAGDAESRRFMRVLFEDLVERIKTLAEGGPSRAPS